MMLKNWHLCNSIDFGLSCTSFDPIGQLDKVPILLRQHRVTDFPKEGKRCDVKWEYLLSCNLIRTRDFVTLALELLTHCPPAATPGRRQDEVSSFTRTSTLRVQSSVSSLWLSVSAEVFDSLSACTSYVAA